jgi:20S proteasome subunit alpha 3
MEAISMAGTVLAILSKEGVVMVAEKASSYATDLGRVDLTVHRFCNEQKVTGKLLDLSLTSSGGEGLEAWTGGGAEKIFLLNK